MVEPGYAGNDSASAPPGRRRSGPNECPARGREPLQERSRAVGEEAAMGAMRRAGVWLGLIEDDDDRGYGDRGYDDEDFVDEVDEAPAPVRTRSSAAERLA